MLRDEVMTDQKLISVVIVNYNSGDYLVQCVQSIINDDELLEAIVVDNGSRDNSVTLVEQRFTQYPQLQIIKNPTNRGFSGANNQGVSIAKGQYILFLNPDCMVKAGVLKRMRQVLEQNPRAGMAGALMRNEDLTIQPTSIRSIPNPWNSLVRVLHLDKFFLTKSWQGLDLAYDAIPTQIQPVPAITGAFMFVRQQALQEVGLLDEGYFLYCEDIDWMYRFQLKQWQILFVPDAEVIHARSICSKQIPLRVLWYKHRGMLYFCHKFFATEYSKFFLSFIYVGIMARFCLLFVLTGGKELLKKIPFLSKRVKWQKSF